MVSRLESRIARLEASAPEDKGPMAELSLDQLSAAVIYLHAHIAGEEVTDDTLFHECTSREKYETALATIPNDFFHRMAAWIEGRAKA